ncbi:hypothetical protein GCM10027610_024570 [Dactylosporangium cerinum]
MKACPAMMPLRIRVLDRDGVDGQGAVRPWQDRRPAVVVAMPHVDRWEEQRPLGRDGAPPLHTTAERSGQEPHVIGLVDARVRTRAVTDGVP